MNVLYICFLDFHDISAANAVRPYQMYQAFLALNWNIKLVATEQMQSNRLERNRQIKEALQWLRYHRPDFCYIESPTSSIKFALDYRLIRTLHKLKIPTAYFYRDFYHKFRGIKTRSLNLKALLADVYMFFKRQKTDRYLKYFDIVYFPSKESTRAFSHPDMRALPPAGIAGLDYQFVDNHTCIYVGGLAKRYGTNILIQAFDLLNKDGCYPLILVCREDELEQYKHIRAFPWLQIVHASGDQLKAYYQKAVLALIPLEHIEYNNIAISVKLYEYLSYGKPVLCTQNEAMANLVRTLDCGSVCKDTAESLAINIKNMLEDKQTLKRFSQNAYHAVQKNENWIQRALQIRKDLLGE